MQKIDRKYFYASVREEGLLHKLTQTQVDSINTILDAIESEGVVTRTWAAYIMATAYHETGPAGKSTHMLPIYERGPISYFSKYDPPNKVAKMLGNIQKGDGFKYRGRGYVQTTGRANYQKIGQRYHVDLINEPDRMLEPMLSAKSMVYMMVTGGFTGKSLKDYLDPKEPKLTDTAQKAKFKSARYIVNGQDKAATIADYALKFLWCFRDDVEPIEIVQPKPAVVPRNTDISTSNMDVASELPNIETTRSPSEEEVVIPKAEPSPDLSMSVVPEQATVVSPPPEEHVSPHTNAFSEWLSNLWKALTGKAVVI